MSKKLALTTTLCLLALATLAYWWFALRQDSPKAKDNSSDPNVATNQIDYSPSTKEDADYVESIKDKLSTDANGQPSQSTDSSMSITITRAVFGNDTATIGSELIGFIADSCTTKISDGMSQIEATSVAVSANGTYGCNAKLNTSSLGKDTDWIVTITANDVNVSQTYSREAR